MEWSPSQQTALQEFDRWLNSSSPRFVLAGYAGTGKSTIQKEFVSRLGGYCTLAAPTGKAALRLSETSGKPASTVHSLIYVPSRDKSTGELRFLYMGEDFRDTPLIIDEASMVSPQMAQDLGKSFSRIIFVGDSFQLPPVKSDDWFGSQPKSATLTEVHRQALTSPILRLATRLREGGEVGPADANPIEGLSVVPRSAIGKPEDLRERYDQIITGMNKTRSSLIKTFRGKSPSLPQPGERIINVNNYRTESQYLPNGEQGVVLDTDYSRPSSPRLSFQTDSGDIYEGVRFHPGYFQHHYSGNITKGYQAPEYSRETQSVLHLDFAAAITVHKSQGSQWDRILFYDDGMFNWGKSLDDRKRWLYTGFTRAAKELTWAI